MHIDTIDNQSAKDGLRKVLGDIKRRVDADGSKQALQDLDALRQAHPEDDAVGRYWFDVALRLGMREKVIPYAHQMLARAEGPMRKADWGARLGQVLMLNTDFSEAMHAYEQTLDVLIELGLGGKIPKPVSPDQMPLNTFDAKKAEEKLWEVLAGLKSAGVKAFPVAGTLLGLVREGSLLPFDKDIDIGIWMEDFRDTCRFFLECGMRPTPMTPRYDNYASYIDPASQIVFDICGMRREPEHMRMVGGFWLYNKPPSYQRVTHFPWIDLVEMERPSGTVWWLKHPEVMLEAIYDDWRTPKPEWDTIISGCNLQAVTLQVRCYAFTRLLNHWLSGDILKASRYLDQLVVRMPSDELVLRSQSVLKQLSQKMRASPSSGQTKEVLTGRADHA